MIVQCDSARFDAATTTVRASQAAPCAVPGIFNVSRFNAKPTMVIRMPPYRRTRALQPFAADQLLTVSATWKSHRPGAFVVNLPADLPDSFGARFNAARFASQSEERSIRRHRPRSARRTPAISARSWQHERQIARPREIGLPSVPGSDGNRRCAVCPAAQALSHRRRADRRARFTCNSTASPALSGFSRAIRARGHQISITVRFAAPAIFDLTVSHAAARFECARVIALTGGVLKPGEYPLPASREVIKPGPVGAVQANARESTQRSRANEHKQRHRKDINHG